MFDNTLSSFINHIFPIRGFLATFLLIVLFSAGGQAQNSTAGTSPAASAPGAPAGSYALSDFDNVNLYNGNLNYSMPLVKIAGRGNIGHTIGIKIDRKWTTVRTPSSNPDVFFWRVIEQERYPVAPKYSPGYLYGYYTGYFPTQCNIPQIQQTGPQQTMTQLMFTSPDGTEYTLRSVNGSGEVAGANPCNIGVVPGFNRGKNFISTDGTAVTFVSDTDIYDNTGVYDEPASFSIYGNLMMSDGTRYRIEDGYVVWAQDRNGNRVIFGYDTNHTMLSSATDSIGREVTIINSTDSSHTNCDEITYKGYGGEVDRKVYVCYTELGSALRMTRTGDPQSAEAWDMEDLFPSGGTSGLYNPNVISYIELPDGRKYNYYYNPYGELARVELPTGAAVEYDYGAGLQNAPYASGYYEGLSNGTEYVWHVYRRINERRLYLNKNDSVPQSRMTYGKAESYNSSNGTITFLDYIEVKLFEGNNQTPTSSERHYYGGPATETLNPYPGYTPPDLGPREIKAETFDSNVSLLRRVTNDWQPGTVFGQGPYNASVTITLADVSPSLTSKQTFAYDQYNNVTDTWEYGFSTDPNTTGPPIRHSHTDYLTTNNSINYTSNSIHIRRLPTHQWVKGYDSNGQEMSAYASYSEMLYDQYGETEYPLLTYGTVTGWTDPSTTARGNLTTAKAWLNTNNSYIQTHIQYDQTGNPRKIWDANGNTSEITYWSYNNTYAFPVTTTSAIPDSTGTNGSNSAFVSTRTFDFSSGLTTSSTDPNGQTTTISYLNSQNVADLLDRPLKVTRPDGGWTAYEYGDTIGNLYLKTTTSLTSTHAVTGYGYFDGLGRSVRRFSQDGNGWIVSDTQYDALGRVYRVSNPYRADSLTASVNSSDLWTTTTYDSLGRVIEVKTPDNAVITTAYSGNTVTVTDQALKKRRSVTDALGRLIRVDEPKADTGELDVSGSPYQSTNYSYDVLDNLLTVTQGVQTRTFVYDSLSRLTSATNPELGTTSTNGTISYTYDAKGNLLTKTDPRNITTTYSYDALNRVKLRDYSDSTPDVSYFYDGKGLSQSPSNSKGALTKVSSSLSETRYTGFDVMGRVTSSQQITNGLETCPGTNDPCTMSYAYNLAGAITSETYPSGRVVTNSFDVDGKLANVSSKANSTATPRTYANSFTYNAIGAVESMRLGNGRFESTQFNSRLQPTQIALGTSANNTSLLKLNYTYGVRDGQGNLDATKNNGNVESQTITVPGMSHPLVQAYTYDALNRLQSATETSNSTQTWKQTFSFDRYGNRMFDTSNNNTTTLPESFDPDIYNPTFNTANNRMDDEQGYEYDAAGNVTKDATNKRFVYDAENKQTSFGTGGSSTNGGTYFYDGDGKRVKKIVGTETTIFVYNASGQMVAEYTTTAPTNPTISYLTSDTLGSPRINTDQSGQVTARHDYMPFGEEIIGLGNRTSGNGYQDDDIRQKFTSKERDNESGLDYFYARYYSSVHGRFTSVDPENAGANEEDPQSWNGYAYARSNPVLYTDPDGLAYIVCDPNGKNCSTVTDQQFYDARRADTKAGFEYTGNRDFFEGGQIKVDGQVQYTYQQISIDDPTREFIFQMRRQTAPIPKATLAFFGLSVALGTGGGVAYYYLGASAITTGTNLAYRGYRTLKVLQNVCFVAGTPVWTKDGIKPIEEINVGDEVLSYNEKTKRVEYKTVVQAFKKFSEEILSVSVEGESLPLGVTPNHPFYVRVHRARDNTGNDDDEGEWLEAGKLKVGNEIKLASGGWAKVLKIERRSGGEAVYNFEVADNHNYFVGQIGLLAHNDCVKVLQTGGNKLKNSTIKALQKAYEEQTGRTISKEGIKQAVEALKKFELRGNDFHEQIMSNGDIRTKAGEIIGNIFQFIP